MHVAIGFHLEGVQQVAGIAQVLAVAAGTQPENKVLPIETEP